MKHVYLQAQHNYIVYYLTSLVVSLCHSKSAAYRRSLYSLHFQYIALCNMVHMIHILKYVEIKKENYS